MKRILFFLLLIDPQLEAKLPQKVIICGVCKNVKYRLPYVIKIMETIGSMFKDYRVIVYENNSRDATPQLLKDWQKNNNRVLAMTERIEKNILDQAIINRLENNDYFAPEAIARARNIVLKKAFSPHYKEFDYLIWIDMDFMLEPNYGGIEEVFLSKREWDAVFAYGIDPENTHWDWYAFRDSRCPIGSELLGNDWWYLPKKLVLTMNDEWYPVISAFGGCGIYRKSSVEGCQYSGIVTEDLAKFSMNIIQNNENHPIIQKYRHQITTLEKNIEIPAKPTSAFDIRDKNVGIIIKNFDPQIIWQMSSFVYKYPSVCEHVPLHASMIIRGHDKLFINPRLIFRYS